MHDLAVIVVSHDQERWLPRCLSTVLEHAQGLSLDLVVVDNGATGASRKLVEREFPQARAIASENRGFAHACNLAAATCDARWLLFLNPDTEVLEGSLAELAAGLAPEAGIAGVRQLDDGGALIPRCACSPRRRRALGDALGLERFPRRPDWLGERELRLERYDREFEGDWTIGSFMLVRREAFDAVGGFDERFFLYSEEVDLCLRVRRAGWKVVAQPGCDDPPPRQLRPPGRPAPADAARLGPAAVRGQEPAARLAAGLPRGAAPALRAPLAARRRAAARGRAGGDRAPPRPPAAAVREPQARATAGRAPCAGARAGRDRRHRRLGNAGAGGDRAARRDVRRLGPEPLSGRARLRRVLRPLGRARARARRGRRAPSAGRPPARGGRRAGPGAGRSRAASTCCPSLPQSCPAFASCTSSATAATWPSPRTRCSCASTATRCSERRTSRRSCARSRSGARSTCGRPTSASAELGDRYLRIRFEDLCAEPAGDGGARCCGFFGLDGDAERIAAEEVQAPPTLGRWRDADPALRAALSERAADALERFGYQSSSE